MKILTLWQPWASLIAYGFKQYETRHWYTPYKGYLLIHAAKRIPTYREKETIINPLKQSNFKDYAALVKFFGQTELPLGTIVAICNLTNCLKMVDEDLSNNNSINISSVSALEYATGYWETERFAWQLDNIIKLPDPIPFKGSQGLKTVSSEVKSLITAFLA